MTFSVSESIKNTSSKASVLRKNVRASDDANRSARRTTTMMLFYNESEFSQPTSV